MTTTIRFYRVNDAYGYFSNFAPYPIELDDKIWPSSEHYFQAQKFPGTEHEEIIRNAATPSEAASLGRQRKRPLRSDWNRVRDDIMRKAVTAKFTQHPELTEILLRTGDAVLIEHTTNDNYWADGGDGSGRNRLGEILMEVRAALQNKA